MTELAQTVETRSQNIKCHINVSVQGWMPHFSPALSLVALYYYFVLHRADSKIETTNYIQENFVKKCPRLSQNIFLSHICLKIGLVLSRVVFESSRAGILEISRSF